MSANSPANPFSALPTFDEKDDQLLNAVIETPKGSRNKFDFDEERGLFYLGGMLPAGASFPFDFGFVPGTLGEDGDPLDVVVLTDEGSTAFPGCLVAVRLLGAIEAEQGKKGEKPERNDRLIGAAATSRGYREVRSLEDVPGEVVKDIEHFFWSYNQAKDIEFKALNHCGPELARKLVEEGLRKKKKA
jgi:inorganic pyrophosphatase